MAPHYRIYLLGIPVAGMMLTELLLGIAIEEEINELRISGSRRP